MSAGKNRQSRQSRQSYRLPLNVAVISAVAHADVWCADRRSLGPGSWIGAAPGCPARSGAGGGAEAPGVRAR